MATIVDERLEGTGYEETWGLGEALGGGATLNEDTATSGITGAPDNWDAQCGVWTYVAAQNCYVGDVNVLIPNEAIVYARLEAICSAESLANNEQNAFILLVGDDGAAVTVIFYLLQDGSGDLRVRVRDQRDATDNDTSSAIVAVDTPIVLESLWDTTNDVVMAWVDGVELVNASLTGAAATRLTDTVIWGSSNSVTAAAETVAMANLIINNADGERVGTGRFLAGLQPISGGVSTKTLNPSHALGGQLNGALQAA